MIGRGKAAREKRSAPEPDDASKPRTPTEIDKPSWKYVVGKTIREFSADQCLDAAAGLTYYAVLAIFPAMIAIFSILGLVGQRAAVVDAATAIVEDVVPEDTAKTLTDVIEQLSQAQGAGIALVGGALVALWSASGYVGAFSRAMNRVYDIEEGRPFWKLRPMQLIVTVVTVIAFAIVGIILVVSGDVVDAVGKVIGLSEGVRIAWSIAKWPLLLIVVILLVALLYNATPNAKQPRFRWISLGAVLAIVILGLATLGFGIYIANFSHYDRTYGSLSGVVVMLLWLWIANLALLFGAEFDAELERGRELQGGIAAEERIQLPPRDSRQSDKREEKERKDIEKGRRIRRRHENRRGEEDEER